MIAYVRMAVDVTGELPLTKSGNKCVLVVMDYFTKCVHLIAVPDQKAVTVNNALVNEVFTKVGIPRFLHSDRGTDFMSKLFQETCKLFNIEKTQTTPWRPKSDGMVERFYRTQDCLLRQFGDKAQDNWDELLPICALTYNSSRHSSTSYTPNFLMFCRDFRMSIELVLPTPDMDVPDLSNLASVDHYVQHM